MCKDCGCSGPHTNVDVSALSHLAQRAYDAEHARLHELGIAHTHEHDGDEDRRSYTNAPQSAAREARLYT